MASENFSGVLMPCAAKYAVQEKFGVSLSAAAGVVGL